MMPGGLPLIRTEWVALGTVCVGFGTAVCYRHSCQRWQVHAQAHTQAHAALYYPVHPHLTKRGCRSYSRYVAASNPIPSCRGPTPQQVTLPLLLRVTGLVAHSPAVRGLAIGAAAHVSGVAALASAGELAAADVASVAAVLVGTVRVALVYVPLVSDGLRLACGDYSYHRAPACGVREEGGG